MFLILVPDKVPDFMFFNLLRKNKFGNFQKVN